ncbi:MAG: hypothetical protein QOG53_3524 [Frankiales bacterium]|nr:hypothetical protein [Frankiales bacterium]
MPAFPVTEVVSGSLDQELRSSRESLRDSPLLVRAREILQALFNFARARLEENDTEKSSERKASQRLADSPASLVERPVLRMLIDEFNGQFKSRHLQPVDHKAYRDVEALTEALQSRLGEDGTGLVTDIAYADLGTNRPMAMLDAVTGRLSINHEHPFVAHFADEFGDHKKNLPLQLFAIAEIALEAQLHDAGEGQGIIDLVLDARDELLRHLARSSGTESSITVAQKLIASASSAKELEDALVQAFRQLGFESVPKGGRDETDGIAEAFLPADIDGVKHYRVSLEASSKQKPGSKVAKKDVEISTVARHRKEARCNHAIVVGPDFVTGRDDLGAVVREIDDDRASNPGKTITLMRIADLARLIRVAPLKRINLATLRGLFEARTPNEAAAWVDNVAASTVTPAPYQTILETVWGIQQDDREHSVDYGSLRTALRLTRDLTITDTELREECSALSRMAPGLFYAREDRVELTIRPPKVLDVIHDYVERAPDDTDS